MPSSERRPVGAMSRSHFWLNDINFCSSIPNKRLPSKHFGRAGALPAMAASLKNEELPCQEPALEKLCQMITKFPTCRLVLLRVCFVFFFNMSRWGKQAGTQTVMGRRFSTANVWTKVTYFLLPHQPPKHVTEGKHRGVWATNNNSGTGSLFSSSRLLSGGGEGFVMRLQTGQKTREKSFELLPELGSNRVQRHMYSSEVENLKTAQKKQKLFWKLSIGSNQPRAKLLTPEPCTL